MAGLLDEWKKVKPSAFDDKIMSAALKELDRAKALWDKAPSRDSLAALGGATKNAVRAADEAEKWAKEKKDAKMSKWLQSAKPSLAAAAQQATILQRGLVTFMQDMDKRRKVVVTALGATASRPSVPVAETALKQAREFHQWLNKEATLYGGEIISLTRPGDGPSRSHPQGDHRGLEGQRPEEGEREEGAVGELSAVAKRLASPLTANTVVKIKGGDVFKAGAKFGSP